MSAPRRGPWQVTTQDDFVSRLLWALSDPGGLPARRFAELDPVPSLDWLEPLSEDRFHHVDLARFGVPSKATVNDKLAFSLTCRPSPYDLAPYMALANASTGTSRWDVVMQQLAHWLIRHLDDPALLLWLVNRGGQLHEELARWIEHRMNELASLEHDGNHYRTGAHTCQRAQRHPTPTDAHALAAAIERAREVVGGRL